MVVETAGSSGVGQQQERVEPCSFRVGRDEPAQEFREPDRLFTEISSDQRRVSCAGVALGEDRRNHLAYGADALGERVQIRRIEGDPGRPDLRPGASESSRHRPSDTRKARAICGVESPATIRKVNATCASWARAGWQHPTKSAS